MRTLAVLVCLAPLFACRKRAEPPAPVPASPGDVPLATAPIVIDGELSEPDWNRLARFGAFVADGADARPVSQIRLLRDPTALYVALYAADIDIRSTDKFDVAIGSLKLAIDARGRMTPEVAGITAHADVESDETIDDPRDDDEEWTVELAIPLRLIPATATTIHAARCDTPHGGPERCGSWDGPLALPR